MCVGSGQYSTLVPNTADRGSDVGRWPNVPKINDAGVGVGGGGCLPLYIVHYSMVVLLSGFSASSAAIPPCWCMKAIFITRTVPPVLKYVTNY